MISRSPLSMKRFPRDWAELYALAYGECSAVVESFLEGTIDVHELRGLHEELNKLHYDRVQNLVMEQARKLQTTEPLG